jgi:hypothetical protein
MYAERESNYAQAHCVVTEHFSCLMGAIVCLISLPSGAGKWTDVFGIQRSVTILSPRIANSEDF